jgi:hypothetical protein
MLKHNLNSVLIAGMAVVITATSLAVTPALARIKKPGLDSISQECFRVQNEADALRAEYRDTSMDRREQILVELRALGSYWIAAGCREQFGDISKFGRLPTNDYKVPESIVDGGGSSPAPQVKTEQAAPGPIFVF